jgi:hypothetical protein
MSAWILIVAFTVSQPAVSRFSANVKDSHAVAMQEFGTPKSCENAGVAAQKIAPGTSFVCVPKGSP